MIFSSISVFLVCVSCGLGRVSVNVTVGDFRLWLQLAAVVVIVILFNIKSEFFYIFKIPPVMMTFCLSHSLCWLWATQSIWLLADVTSLLLCGEGTVLTDAMGLPWMSHR